MQRLFFALWPDDTLRAPLQRQARELLRFDPRARLTLPARYHLTLKFVGGFSEVRTELLDALLAAGDAVPGRGFEMVLDTAGCFPGARVAWLGCQRMPPALASLQSVLDSAVLRLAGIPADAGFVPHVTLLRNFRAALAPVEVAPLAWSVDSFGLFESRAGEGYRLLRQWPLERGH